MSGPVGRLSARIVDAARHGGIGRALSNRPYRIYTSGNAISLIGTWVQRVGVGWLMWSLTESGMWLGLVAAAELLPSLIGGPIGGAVADRIDRLRLTRISQMVLALQAVALGVLTLAGLMTPLLLIALTAILGAVTAFNQPARMSLVPALVRAEDVPAAVAVNSVLWNGARFVGPALAGFLIVSFGVGWAFLVNALSYVALLVALARLDVVLPRAQPTRLSIWRQITEGVGHVAHHPGLGPLLLLLIVGAVFARPFAELLPGFADAVFGHGAAGLAMLNAAIGVGAVTAGLWMSQRGRLRGTTSLAIGHTALLAGSLLLFVATSSMAVGLVAVAIAGWAMVVTGVGNQSLIQSSTDPAMLGRVLSLYGMSFRAGPALGAILMGAASEWTGLRIPVAAGALICLVGWLVVVRRQKRIAVVMERGRGPKNAMPVTAEAVTPANPAHPGRGAV